MAAASMLSEFDGASGVDRDVSSPPMPRKSRAAARAVTAAFRRAAAALVPPPRPRPALAPHPRSLSHRGVGVHAAADPGRRGWRRTTTAFSSAYPTIQALAAPRRRRCGRAGRDWATTAERPTCTGWRKRWWSEHAGVIPARSGRAGPAARGGAIHRRGGGLLRLRAARAAVDTNVARVLRRAFHPRAGRARRASARSGRPRSRLVPRGGTRRPGRSIRRSWSWERWSAPPGWRDAATARCGRRARQEGCG